MNRLVAYFFDWKKPNEILQFKWKSMVSKFKPKLNLKFLLKGNKTRKNNERE